MELWVLPRTDLEITTEARPPASTIVQAAEDLFRRSGYLALRDVACIALGGTLYLQGRLPSYYLKQVAQEIAVNVAGVRRVINRIDVSVPAGRAPVGRERALRFGERSGLIGVESQHQRMGRMALPTHIKGVCDMLVLSRKLSETIVIDGGIRITVVGIRGNQVRLGIDAPGAVGIFREELCVQAGASARVGPTGLVSAARRGTIVGSTT